MSAVTTNEAFPADVSLAGLCARVRPELAALGDLGAALVAALAVVERTGGARGVDALADPAFALDVLTAAGPGTDAAVVGRVLDFLRARSATAPVGVPAGVGLREVVTVASAVDRYLAGPLAVMAEGTRSSYQPWARRLVSEYGDRDPATLVTGDLRDLVARWVVTIRETEGKQGRRRQGGRAAEGNAVHAFRHLWAYLVEKRWATENIASALRKPTAPDSRRRPWRPEEAALVRQLARSLGRDPLLNEVLVSIPERMGLRRTELRRLRICDIDLDRRIATVWGKGDKDRETPIPPHLAGLLGRFIENRRPTGIPPDVWARSTEPLLRSRPTRRYPHGKQVGQKRPDALFESLHAAAPDLFAGDDLSLHCYRHALGTWIEPRYGRKATRSILGHRGRKDPTDYYVWVPLDDQARILSEYENHLLAADPRNSLGPDGGRT